MMGSNKHNTKRMEDIVRNASFSFQSEGCPITAHTEKQAHLILSGQISSSTVIEEYSKSYHKGNNHD